MEVPSAPGALDSDMPWGLRVEVAPHQVACTVTPGKAHTLRELLIAAATVGGSVATAVAAVAAPAALALWALGLEAAIVGPIAATLIVVVAGLGAHAALIADVLGALQQARLACTAHAIHWEQRLGDRVVRRRRVLLEKVAAIEVHGVEDFQGARIRLLRRDGSDAWLPVGGLRRTERAWLVAFLNARVEAAREGRAQAPPVALLKMLRDGRVSR